MVFAYAVQITIKMNACKANGTTATSTFTLLGVYNRIVGTNVLLREYISMVHLFMFINLRTDLV